MAIVETNPVTIGAGGVTTLKTATVVAANGNGGAADTVDVTIQVTDLAGTEIAQATMLAVWLSDNANGAGGSAHTHSTNPAFAVGAIQQIMVANDAWIALTDETGEAILRLVDTANEDVTINVQVLGGPGTLVQDTTVAADWDPA